LATLTDEVFSRQGWLFEPKWDGERCLAFRTNLRMGLSTNRQNRVYVSPLRTYLATELEYSRNLTNQTSQPAAANVLFMQDSEPKLHKKSASGSQEKLPLFPQIVRQRWIIFGEFVVSLLSLRSRHLG
jgi:hypothetical protein